MSTTGGSAIRGSRVGAGPMGEEDRGHKVQKIFRTYYCIMGHQHTLAFAADILTEDIRQENDCPNCGLPAGLELHDNFGTIVIINLSKIQINKSLKSDTFKFTPPSGADVLKVK